VYERFKFFFLHSYSIIYEQIVNGSEDAPEIARTLPTSSVEKFKPPRLGGLTHHKEKT
jgi:hypothetical protein